MKTAISLLILCLSSYSIAYSQSILGKWISIDDETGAEKAVVEIYEEDGKYHGKIVQFLEEGVQPDDACEHCKGSMKGKQLMGFHVLKNFEAKGERYENGTVTDPEADKTYDSKIWVDTADNSTLYVRGYVSFFYRTQEWKRYAKD
jgi:uncharacterized protein (DUF2147 family)